MTDFKRVYFKDCMTVIELLNKGYGYASTLAEKMGRSLRAIQYTLRKLEDMGWVKRHGKARCCFQWYSVDHRNQVNVTRITDFLYELFLNGKRTYFTIEFVTATLRCSYDSRCLSGRVGDRSVGFGERAAISVVEVPIFDELWVPLEVLFEIVDSYEFERVAWFFSDFGVEFEIPEDSYGFEFPTP